MLFAIVEYGMGNEVSTDGDICSYSILLLEMFTRKRPIDNMFKDNLNLHDFVKGVLPKRVIDIVDSSFGKRRYWNKDKCYSQSILNWMSQNFRVLDFDIWNWSFLFYGIPKGEDEHYWCCSSAKFD